MSHPRTSTAFPSNPSNGDTVTRDGISYIYNSTNQRWETEISSNIDIVTKDTDATYYYSNTVSETVAHKANDELLEVPEVDLNFIQLKQGVTGLEKELTWWTLDLQEQITSVSSSVFDGAFSSLTGTPTTLAGYGITDAFDGAYSSLTGAPTNVSSFTNDANYLTTVAFADLTGKPTTLSGYGITDAFDGAFSSLTGTPTTLAGYGITDAFDGAYSSLTGSPTNISTFTNDAGYLTSVSFANLTSTPTTLSGYGITDAFDGTYASLTGAPTNVSEFTNDANYLTSVAFSDLTSTPTTSAGYGITDAFDGDFSSLTGVPTTLAGYGISDAAPNESPSFTGTPTAPTPGASSNDTSIATTAFVQNLAGAQSIGDLTDVQLSTPVSDGQVLAYSISSQKFVNQNQSGGTGGSSIDFIVDGGNATTVSSDIVIFLDGGTA